MAIAEQLQRIAEKQQQVYNSGYEKGKSEGGNTEEAYNIGFEAGKKSEQDTFWDIFQQKGKRTDYRYAFCSISNATSGWNDNNYNPKYPIISACGESIFQCFQGSSTIVPIKLTESTTATNMFFSCTKLVTITKLILDGTVTKWQNAFLSCSNLENITIEGNIYTSLSFSPCSKLTYESLMSIINALAVVTTTQTLTLHATAKTKLTEADIATITQKGWTLA